LQQLKEQHSKKIGNGHTVTLQTIETLMILRLQIRQLNLKTKPHDLAAMCIELNLSNRPNIGNIGHL